MDRMAIRAAETTGGYDSEVRVEVNVPVTESARDRSDEAYDFCEEPAAGRATELESLDDMVD
jgi:hypothetical protein